MGDIKAVVFRDGRVSEHATLDAGVDADSDAAFAWIEAFNLEDGELGALQQRFALNRLAVADANRPVQFPKVDLYDDQVFVVLKSASLDGDAIGYSEIGAFVSARHIVTVYRGDGHRHEQAHQRLHELTKLARITPDFILHSIVDHVVAGFFPVLQMVEDDVLSMEQHLQDALLDRAEITRLFRLRREAIHLQHVLAGMADVCGKLTNLEVPCIGAAVKPYFRDVHDQLARLDRMVRGLVHVIRTVFEASSLLEIQRQGIITRQLAAWAAILGVPAAMAALYGMISPDIAGLQAMHRIALVVVAMVASCVVLFLRFRKLRWL